MHVLNISTVESPVKKIFQGAKKCIAYLSTKKALFLVTNSKF